MSGTGSGAGTGPGAGSGAGKGKPPKIADLESALREIKAMEEAEAAAPLGFVDFPAEKIIGAISVVVFSVAALIHNNDVVLKRMEKLRKSLEKLEREVRGHGGTH